MPIFSTRNVIRVLVLNALLLILIAMVTVPGRPLPESVLITAEQNYETFGQRVFNNIKGLRVGDLFIRWGHPDAALEYGNGFSMQWDSQVKLAGFPIRLQATAICPRATRSIILCRVVTVIMGQAECTPFVEPRC